MNMEKVREQAWKAVNEAETKAKKLRTAAEALDAALSDAPARVAALATKKEKPRSEGRFSKLSRDELERRLRFSEQSKELLRRQLHDPEYRGKILVGAEKARTALAEKRANQARTGETLA